MLTGPRTAERREYLPGGDGLFSSTPLRVNQPSDIRRTVRVRVIFMIDRPTRIRRKQCRYQTRLLCIIVAFGLLAACNDYDTILRSAWNQLRMSQREVDRPFVRRAVVDSILQLGPSPQARELLEVAILDPDPVISIRALGVSRLFGLNKQDQTGIILEKTHALDPFQRFEAWTALLKHPEPGTVTRAEREALRDPHPFVRGMIACELLSHGVRESVPLARDFILLDYYETPSGTEVSPVVSNQIDVQTKLNCLTRLSSLEKTETIDWAMRHSKRLVAEVQQLKRRLALSLEKTTSFDPDRFQTLNTRWRARLASMLLLSGFCEQSGSALAREIFLSELGSDDTTPTLMALHLIGKLGLIQLRGVVITSLVHSDWGIRAAAVRALPAVGNSHDIEMLQRFLRDDTLAVRMESALALCRLGSHAGDQLLRSALFESKQGWRNQQLDWTVKTRIVQQLGQRGDMRSIVILHQALLWIDPYSRVMAAKELLSAINDKTNRVGLASQTLTAL